MHSFTTLYTRTHKWKTLIKNNNAGLQVRTSIVVEVTLLTFQASQEAYGSPKIEFLPFTRLLLCILDRLAIHIAMYVGFFYQLIMILFLPE